MIGASSGSGILTTARTDRIPLCAHTRFAATDVMPHGTPHRPEGLSTADLALSTLDLTIALACMLLDETLLSRRFQCDVPAAEIFPRRAPLAPPGIRLSMCLG